MICIHDSHKSSKVLKTSPQIVAYMICIIPKMFSKKSPQRYSKSPHIVLKGLHHIILPYYFTISFYHIILPYNFTISFLPYHFIVFFHFLTIEDANTDLVMKDVGKVESYRDPRESMILSR